MVVVVVVVVVVIVTTACNSWTLAMCKSSRGNHTHTRMELPFRDRSESGIGDRGFSRDGEMRRRRARSVRAIGIWSSGPAATLFGGSISFRRIAGACRGLGRCCGWQLAGRELIAGKPEASRFILWGKMELAAG